jgi:hypothetical protein
LSFDLCHRVPDPNPIRIRSPDSGGTLPPCPEQTISDDTNPFPLYVVLTDRLVSVHSQPPILCEHYSSECIRKAAYKKHIFHNTEFHRIRQLTMQIMLLTLHKFMRSPCCYANNTNLGKVKFIPLHTMTSTKGEHRYSSTHAQIHCWTGGISTTTWPL